MKFTNICTREIFPFCNDEEARVLEYNICESENSNGISYGIQIVSKGKFQKMEIIENVCSDKDLINKIVVYLSQNGVDEVSFKDVVKDLLFQIEYDNLKQMNS